MVFSFSFSLALMQCSSTPCFRFGLHLETLPFGFCSKNFDLSHPQLCTTHPGTQFGFSFLHSAKSAFTQWHSILQNLAEISLGGFWVYTVFIPYVILLELREEAEIYTLVQFTTFYQKSTTNVYKQNYKVSHHVYHFFSPSSIKYKDLQVARAQEVFAKNGGSVF